MTCWRVSRETYQVGSAELGAPGVQRLEYLLSVLVGGEVDDDDLKQFSGRTFDGLCSAEDVFLSGHLPEPFRDLHREVSMGIR